jgi:hypothetical protein
MTKTAPARTAFSVKPQVDAAVQEVQQQLGAGSPRLLLVFAASSYPPEEVAAKVAARFPGVPAVGCTTAGEIVTGHMLDQSLVVMALDENLLGDVHVEVVSNPGVPAQVDAAMDGFARHFGKAVTELDPGRYFGLALIDGLSGAEERCIERIGDRSDLLFVGGSAGDDLKFQRTHVFAGGRAHTNAAVLVIAESKTRFQFCKTQSFKSTGRKLCATKVDEAARRVDEFDGQPAATAYAKAVGAAPGAADQEFMRHPLGLMVDGVPFVRSPQRFLGNGLCFYCNVRQGTELEVLESTDIVADTRRDVLAARKELGSVAAIINFHCILRTLELKQRNQTGAYGEIFADVPTIGFSTYGEILLGHINQTSTILLLGAP